jgi:hypothetical protein
MDRKKGVFWRRGKPELKHDITALRPASLPKGKRFETLQDVQAESERSENLLRPVGKKKSLLTETLLECREGYYDCDEPFCPICARGFRRWLIGELLRITEDETVQVMTVLLKAAERTEIESLDPTTYGHLLRKRLQRAGLGDTPVIGGYEIVYRAQDKRWILHINLVMIGGDSAAIEKFKQSFSDSELDRPFVGVALKDRPEQLSYVLKFTTYHRPHERTGAKRQAAKPLNRREHQQLVNWMALFGFPDFLFLYNARRQGSMVVTAA